jgi:STE24 endopeptidase
MFFWTKLYDVTNYIVYDLFQDPYFDTLDYRYFLLCCYGFFFCVEQYLRLRKRFALYKGYPKEDLKGIVTEEEYNESYPYNMYKNGWGFCTDTYATVNTVLMVFYWPVFWGYTHDILAAHNVVNMDERNGQMAHVCLFTIFTSLADLALGLPVSLLRTFHIEEKFGFNNTTATVFVSDTLKSFLMNLVISNIMSCGMVFIVEWAGQKAWFYLWVYVSILVFVLNTLYPVLIAPLFNTFTPLEDGKLKTGIEALIKQTGLDCRKVFMVDGSKQSNHSNAYVAGMCGTKRIVIYDTLVKDLDNDVDAIKAVVGHEIGHSIFHHNWMLLVASLGNIFVMFFSYGLVENVPAVVTSFGFELTSTRQDTFLKIHCFLALYGMAIMPFWSVLMNAMVRQLEYSADRYAVQLGYDINSSLVKISKTNKADLNPDWLHSMWHHNHPTLLERLDAATLYKEGLEKKKK